mmetsp:Transcript_2029/g.8011  ORF Transcript_2029/g.8011 Transcript_2029/m.8011 type:complete len:239 (-) Transcript_2029:571-1287(-)
MTYPSPGTTTNVTCSPPPRPPPSPPASTAVSREGSSGKPHAVSAAQGLAPPATTRRQKKSAAMTSSGTKNPSHLCRSTFPRISVPAPSPRTSAVSAHDTCPSHSWNSESVSCSASASRGSLPKTYDAGAGGVSNSPRATRTKVDASDARRLKNSHPSGKTTPGTPLPLDVFNVLWLVVTRYGRFAASAQSVARSPRAASTRRSRNAPPGAKVFFARFTAHRRLSVPSSDLRPETPSRR